MIFEDKNITKEEKMEEFEYVMKDAIFRDIRAQLYVENIKKVQKNEMSKEDFCKMLDTLLNKHWEEVHQKEYSAICAPYPDDTEVRTYSSSIVIFAGAYLSTIADCHQSKVMQ
jgi:hypothetical protein